MYRRIALAILGPVVLCLPAAAQDAAPADPALLAAGEVLYSGPATFCVTCHQANGEGVPPSFPALAANEKLADPALIVSNIHNGKGAMPPFPDLTPEEIAALATYVRNSWGNGFGGVSAAEVSDLLAALPQATVAGVSVWDGVYTQAQSDRGKIFYSGICAKCHGRNGNGAGDPDQPESPSVARQAFLTKWEGRSLASLYEYVRTTMPQDNPNSRADQEYIDAVAYMLTLSQIPPGETELAADPAALEAFVIGPKPAE